jgi:hypothetical protein
MKGKRECDTVCDTGIQKSTMRKIHSTEAKMNFPHARATPSAAVSKTRPEIMEKIEKLL